MKKIAIIIPVFNRRDLTLNCLYQLSEKVEKRDANYTIVVVDNGSSDGTGEQVRKQFPEVILLEGDGSLWWTGAINMGLEYVLDHDFDYALFLNDDLELDPQFLHEMISVTKKNKNALVSSLKVFITPSGVEKIVVAGFFMRGFMSEIIDPFAGKQVDVLSEIDSLKFDILTGAALLVPTSIVRTIGFLDKKRFPHNWGDFEFTRRASITGYDCILATRAKIYTDKNNPNYHYSYLINSRRIDYLVNSFEKQKYNYGFNRIMRTSFMHRPFIPALLICIRRMIGLLRWIFLKMILPQSTLSKLIPRHDQ